MRFLTLAAVLASTISFGLCDEQGKAYDILADGDDVVCQIKVLDIQYEDRDGEQEYRCIIQSDEPSVNSDMTYAVDLDKDSVAAFKTDLDSGKVYATVPRGKVSRKKGARDQVVAPPGTKIKLSKGSPKNQNIPKRRRRRPSDTSNSRRLTVRKIGTSTVLVLRVSSADRNSTLTAKELSDRIFGTDGDKVNLLSVYSDCSAGKLKFVPATGPNILNGVGEIVLPQKIGGMSSVDVDNLVVAVGNTKFGELSRLYDHVMLCLPPGTAGTWLAYGYLNWYRSSYNDLWCGYPSAQAHEVGHNLGLLHSNEGDTVYGDQSSLMGYSYASNEGPKMCFDGHKNWLLGWYDDRKIVVDPKSTGSWTGKLATFVDYKATSPNEYVLVKVGNLHLQYNRKKDFNSGTVEKADQVTITEGNTTRTMSNSLAGLGNGASFKYENYDGINPLIIKVCGIFNNMIPNYVHLSIFIEGPQTHRCNEIPTSSPTTQMPSISSNISTSQRPTKMPTPLQLPILPTTQGPVAASTLPPVNTLVKLPSSIPQTTLRPTLSTSTPTSRPISSPTSTPTSAPTIDLTTAPTIDPTTASTIDPTTAPTVDPTSAPTVNPTSVPTVNPTSAPAVNPTSAPTVNPTSAPTVNPTSAPTVNPTWLPSLPPSLPSSLPSFIQTSSPSHVHATFTPSAVPSIGRRTIAPTAQTTSPLSAAPTLSPLIAIVTPSVEARPTRKPATPRDVQSISPSSEPSEPQSRIPNCHSNETWFQLSIKTDLYPAETEWELRNAAKTVTLKGGPYEVANEEYRESVCIPNDAYVFQMKDKYGDGICCDNGAGSYVVSMDGVELASGGEFGLVEETKIKPRCGTGEARISVAITTDYFGSETSWTLRTLAGSQVMGGSGYKSWETREDTQCIDSSTCYVFTIRDEWGDGMCCNYGVGGYTVKFGGSTYGGSFENGYADAVRIGSACPVFTIVETHRHRAVKRRRHKANARAISLRDPDFAQAQNNGLKNRGE